MFQLYNLLIINDLANTCVDRIMIQEIATNVGIFCLLLKISDQLNYKSNKKPEIITGYNVTTVRYGTVCYVMLCYGMVWYGMVWYGMVWYGMVW